MPANKKGLATPAEESFEDDDDIGVEWVDVSETFAAPYQRALTPARRKALEAKPFNGRRAGVVLLSYRDKGAHKGEYAEIDGQGRIFQAKHWGVTRIRARVLHGLTEAEEADLYLVHNTERVATTPVQEFAAALEAKNKQALAVNKIIQSLDLTVSSTAGAHSIKAIRICLQIYADRGSENLEITLELLQRSWADNKKCYSAMLIDGMSQFLLRYQDEVDEDTLVERLQSTTPEQVMGLASLIKAGNALADEEEDAEVPASSHIYTAAGMAIRHIYNKRRRSKRLSRWVKGQLKKAA